MSFAAKRLLALVAIAASFVAVKAQSAQPSLKEAYKGIFLIGAALNRAQFEEATGAEAALVRTQFNSISPENVLKWESVHPEPDRYSFEGPDRYVSFGEKNGMFVIGHTLVWHNQTPKWVFEDGAGQPAGRELLLQRMRDHIRTVVGRYKGRIKGWDVVNEALDEDGTLRQSPWLKIIGEDYIAKAFQFAHEADPQAELYYNDYSLENEAKRRGAVALIKRLQAAGVPVTAVGLQGHQKMDFPTLEQEEATIKAFADLGVKVNITELDVDVLPRATRSRGAEVTTSVRPQAALNPYSAGLPADVQQALAKRYEDLFGVYLKHRDVITRVTFWGVTDKNSWLNNWPVRGRTSYPLLFDRQGQPKPAFYAVIRASRQNSAALARTVPAAFHGQVQGAVSPLLAKSVAVTIDDLPLNGPAIPPNRLQTMTDKFLSAIKTQELPVVGFVNESLLYQPGETDARIALLRSWADAGVELGNHTFSHLRFKDIPLSQYQDDFVRGDTVTRVLMKQKNLPLRYFRHPFLQMGPTRELEKTFENFIAERGYRIAPVTIDSLDWMILAAYAKAQNRGDAAMMKKVSEEYLKFVDLKFEYCEQAANDLFGRPINHILLLHANELNADNFAGLIRVIKNRGYRFITLEQALNDPVYQYPDKYSETSDWLQLWSLSKGRQLTPPMPAGFIQQAFRGK